MRLSIFFCFLALAGRLAAEEKILSFESDIRVREDATMIVTETIRVVSEGNKIKRGIYRDFPTVYRNAQGRKVRVGFKVLQVLHNGAPEQWKPASISNGKRIYIGSPNQFISNGEHTYTLAYDTNRQLGFFDQHDELYWNVTGNGWDFPIDSAKALVGLPGGVLAVSRTAYTGPQGARGREWESRADGQGKIVFETTAPLGPREGLTVVVGWPKGYVKPPDARARLGYLFEDMDIPISTLAATGLVVLYFLGVWVWAGKDPDAGVIVPQFEPPKKISPAACRYIRSMGYDDKTFACALMDMAVKGCVEIEEKKGGKITVTQKGEWPENLSHEEKAVADKLFKCGSSVEFKVSNHEIIGETLKHLKKTLKTRYQNAFFVTNLGYFVIGAVLTLGAIWIMGFSQAREQAGFLFMTVWLSGWTAGVFVLGREVSKRWRSAWAGGGVLEWFGGIFMTVFALPFFAGEVGGIYMLHQMAGGGPVFMILALAPVNYFFYHWLKAPTLYGRRFLDQLEGFRLFLKTTEEHRLNTMYPAGKTPELFEKFLPYALALDVEQEWAEQFAEVLAPKGAQENGSYHPSWYRGNSWNSTRAGAFASALGGTVAAAAAASASPPGSSSGGGGGGSSGGGGGGGGGGGW